MNFDFLPPREKVAEILKTLEFCTKMEAQVQLRGTLKPIGNIEIDELKEKFRL
jgi:hypothetical protein